MDPSRAPLRLPLSLWTEPGFHQLRQRLHETADRLDALDASPTRPEARPPEAPPPRLRLLP